MSNKSDDVSASGVMNSLMDRLRIGAHLPEPYGHVTEREIAEVATVLQSLTRNPNQCTSRAELLSTAEKALGRCYILEQRHRKMRIYLDGYAEQCMKLPEGDMLRKTFETMFNTFDQVLKGEK